MLLLVANTLLARPQLHDLNIKVVLSRNGDARITETRLMSIDSEGTECFIGLANMGESEIRDLEVTDESGTRFMNVDWDIHEDRSWKTMKCGIVRTKSGYACPPMILSASSFTTALFCASAVTTFLVSMMMEW